MFRDGFQWCPLHGVRLEIAEPDPLVGTTIAGRYKVEALVGEGGVGRVYAARHVRLSRRFAIKVPFGDLAHDPSMRRRFFREAEAAGRLAHPNVVGVVDVGETEHGLVYMALDLVQGPSLSKILDVEGALPPSRVGTIFRQLVEGLAHAHDRGLIHRDLKPGNIVIGRDSGGEELARIIDFGIAIPNDLEEQGRLTTESIIVGTPYYMAPEQAGGGLVDARTDLFALGLILYEMLAGVTPFTGNSLAVIQRLINDRPPPIAERVPALVVDRRLEEVAFWLMEKSPAARPASARALRAALDKRPHR